MLNPITKYINLDFTQELNNEVVLSQYDKNSRQIIAKLYNNGVAWNELNTSTGSTMSVNLFGKKSDDKNILQSVTITGTNEITMTISDQFTTTDGNVKAKITIYDTDNEVVISPLSFVMHVDPAPFPEDAIISQDDFSLLSEMILNVQTLTVNIPSYVARSETAATNAETSEANALTSETNAKLSETNASASATNANTYATNSANSATASATSATNAQNSATSAANSATQAVNTINAEIARATGTVTNSTIAPLEINEIKGKSIQGANPTPTSLQAITTTGDSAYNLVMQNKNWLQNTATTQTVSGVTFTINDDKSVTVRGQVPNGTGSTWLAIGTVTLQPGTYYASGGISSTAFINFSNGIGNVVQTLFTLTEKKAIIATIGLTNNGATYNGEIFYPMVRLAADTDTTYKAYSRTTTPLNIPLASSGVTDYDKVYLDTDGKWKQSINVGTIIFNGTESWIKSSTTSGDVFTLKISSLISNIKPMKYMETEGVCSHFIKQKTFAYNPGTFYYGSDVNTFLYFNFTNYGTTNLAAFKTWLTSNNVTLKYPLATPTIEVLSDELQTALGNLMSLEGTMTVTTDDITNPEVVYNYARNSVTAKDVIYNNKRIRQNESDISSLKTAVGTDDLTTTANTITSAINELDSEIGNVALSTTAQNVKEAINELDSEIGNVALSTTAQNVKEAINELDGEIGSDILVTTSQTVKGGINELDSRIDNLLTTRDISVGARAYPVGVTAIEVTSLLTSYAGYARINNFIYSNQSHLLCSLGFTTASKIYLTVYNVFTSSLTAEVRIASIYLKN